MDSFHSLKPYVTSLGVISVGIAGCLESETALGTAKEARNSPRRGTSRGRSGGQEPSSRMDLVVGDRLLKERAS